MIPLNIEVSWSEESGVIFLMSFILGFLSFYGIPHVLDKYVDYSRLVYGPEFFLFSSVIFINIHHYFIDFAIWRRGNKNIKKYIYATNI